MYYNARMNNLKIAISQFPVTNAPAFNMSYIRKQTRKASFQGADVIHFPETALSGYGTISDSENWKEIEHLHEELRQLAKESNIFIVAGTQFPSIEEGKPLNSTLVISDRGELLGSYIKSRLYGKEKERFASRDNHLVVDIKGVKCGFLICYESCFMNLFSKYKELGAQFLFLSYFNAGNEEGENSLDDMMLSQIKMRASDYGFYISGSNSSKPHSRLASGMAFPDGTYEGLEKHEIGFYVCDLPKEEMGWTHFEESWPDQS